MHICVILVDSLRADHLGCYGYYKETSPHIDAIAQNGVLFENAVAQSNWTLPSLYALISGRYPMVFNISWFDQKINRKFIVLPELLKNAGYHTAIFSNFEILLNPASFASYFKEKRYIELNENTAGAFRTFLDKQKDSFLFFHIGEYVHEPFKADKKYVHQFLEGNYQRMNMNSEPIRVLTAVGSEDNLRNMMGKINKGLVRINKNEARYLLACYDAGIYYVDKFVGELYNAFREKSDNYLFIFTADHGQAFFEHGILGHGYSLYNELTNVPLIIDYNNNLHTRVSSPVQLMDIYPTIIDIIGYERNFELDGKPFSSVLINEKMTSELKDRIAVSEGYPYIMIRNNDYKLISSYSKFLAGSVIKSCFNTHEKTRSLKKDLISKCMRFLPDKLYNMGNDRDERNNLRWRNRSAYFSLKLELSHIIKKAINDKLPPDIVNLDSEIMKQLETLGYL